MANFKPQFLINKIIFLITILFLFLFQKNTASASISSFQSSQNNAIQTRLLISTYQQENKKKLIGAIHFKIKDGWKLYGEDSQGVGMPLTLDFNKFKNYKSHKIIWPQAETAEEKIGKEIIKYSYYKNEVIIPFEINTSAINISNQLDLKITFAFCKDVCVPVDQEFSINFGDEDDLIALEKIQKFYDKILSTKTINNNSQSLKTNSSSYFAIIIFFAFIGGLILNIMPCVLPVISIKLISIVNHQNASLQKIRSAFIATFLGILICFFILALITITLRSMGDFLGWGLQFQNPYFLVFLIVILIFFIAEFLDIFVIDYNKLIANFLNKKINQSEKSKNIFIPNFLSGVLAVLLATPCSAPFLGSAISFTITQQPLIVFIIFSTIGIGFGFPYLALMINPKIVKILPKPGNWMYRLKQLMAGFLMATIIWLIHILSKNIGAPSAFILAFLAIAIFGVLSLKGQIKKIIFIPILIFLSFNLPFEFQQQQLEDKNQYDRLWIKFSQENLDLLLAQNKVILVDITADWCLTCKYNKIRVLKTKEIVDKLKKGEIIGLRGDITKPDQKIMEYMKSFNRYAIPFNVVYGPNAKSGILTSELLDKQQLLETIEKAQ